MALIDEWRAAWKFLSVQANVLGVAISSSYAVMYDQLKETVPPTVVATITGVVFVLGIIGRLTVQKTPDDGKDAP
jgi:hypothetical protein